MSAGAERAAGVDDDVDQAVLWIPPRRAHADPAPDLDRPVEVGPAVRPVVGDRRRGDVDQAAPGSRLELPEIRHLPGWPVDRELDPARAALLLESVRRQFEQVRQHLLRVLGSAANCEPDHRRGEGWRWRTSARRSAASRCSSSRSVGTTSSKTTCWSPRRPPCSGGRPRFLSTATEPCWVPAGTSTATSPSSVGTNTSPPTRAVVTGTSALVISSVPWRVNRSSWSIRIST